MALTALETEVCNSALDRLGCSVFTVATQTMTPTGLACVRNYEKLRDTLLRSFLWPWATRRATLSQIETLVLDTSPTVMWAVGDVITGIASGATAEILTATSETQYEIIYRVGTFTLGETITNSTVENVYWQGIPLLDGIDQIVSFDTSGFSQVVCGAENPVVSAITPAFKWTFQYHIPDDFLRLRSIYEDDGVDWESERWEIEGKRILTHYATLNIQYIRKVTLPTDFDSLFEQLLVLTLANRILPTLVGSKSAEFKEDLKKELERTQSKAMSVCKSENNTSGRSDFTLSKYGN